MEITLLGNGPSLSLYRDHDDSSEHILGCNRLFFLEGQQIDWARVTYCLADKSMGILLKTESRLVKTLSQCRSIVIASDIDITDHQSFTSSKSVRVDVKRGCGSYYTNVAVNNLWLFPRVYESCSVLFTLMMPIAVAKKPKVLKLYGFDGSYSARQRYFYDEAQNPYFTWSNDQSDRWADAFGRELESLKSFLKASRVEIRHYV